MNSRRNRTTCSGAHPDEIAWIHCLAKVHRRKLRIASQPFQEIVRTPVPLDLFAGRLTMPPDSLVQFLAIAPGRHGCHQDIFGGHKGQFFPQVPGDRPPDRRPGRRQHVRYRSAGSRRWPERLAESPDGDWRCRRAYVPSIGSRRSEADLICRLITNRASPQIRSLRIGFRL